MGCHASIRGAINMELIPEFLWKYMDSPHEEKIPVDWENQNGKTG